MCEECTKDVHRLCKECAKIVQRICRGCARTSGARNRMDCAKNARITCVEEMCKKYARNMHGMCIVSLPLRCLEDKIKC